MRARFRTRHRLRCRHRRDSPTRHPHSLRERCECARTMALLSKCQPFADGTSLDPTVRMASRRQTTSGNWKSLPHRRSARGLHPTAARQELRKDRVENQLALLTFLDCHLEFRFVILNEVKDLQFSAYPPPTLETKHSHSVSANERAFLLTRSTSTRPIRVPRKDGRKENRELTPSEVRIL